MMILNHLNNHQTTDLSDDRETSVNPQMSRRSIDSVKGWDVFDVTIRDIDDDDTHFYETLMKIVKLIVLLMSFAIVFIGSLISKSSILLMSSMIGNQHMKICYKNIAQINRTHLAQFAPQLIATVNITNHINNINHDQELMKEKIAWLWTLFMALIFPEILTFLRSARICLCKTSQMPTKRQFIMVFLVESFVTLSLSIFEFDILPSTNVIFALMMTSSLAFVPSILNIFTRKSDHDKSKMNSLLNIISFTIQLISIIVWPLYLHYNPINGDTNVHLLIATPIVLILISLTWIENYLPSQLLSANNLMAQKRETLNDSRYIIYLFIAPLKIIITFGVLLITVQIQDGKIVHLFDNFNSFHQEHIFIITDNSSFTNKSSPLSVNSDLVTKSKIHIQLLLIHILASFVCYTIAKFACKICIQSLGFALPLTLITPTIGSILMFSCQTRGKSTCLVYDYFPLLPGFVFWSCPSTDLTDLQSDSQLYLLIILWLLTWSSQAWISRHIWCPSQERASKTEKLFVNPMYLAPIIDVSMCFNRRRDESILIKDDDDDFYYLNNDNQRSTTGGLFTIDDGQLCDHNLVHNSDKITRIYACATMWHETRDEMIQTLKSIMRMDEDQSARENAQKYLKIIDPDYYQFETHILFDDAFVASDEDENEMVVNRYVRQLVEVINDAASIVHKTHLKLRPPSKIPTLYGGRLIWTLPGKNKLIVHLKDKALIRHRKRWSQVMYMYYLLGHLLMDTNLNINRKAIRGENTYILALDGDIDFKTNAVLLLVDLMKKNSNLGAACGRIHPIGTGLMVWYQKFEYAVSHWLQKASEHVFGCVLCSPGCFSLFRARALMSPNVMKRYASQSKDAKDYVQFDQGEDRWLCTLLLQSGYRVEYNAASDAYTHCPESFGEFYSQRRRWAPSTMANILNLLQDYRDVVRVNRDISYFYILYHGLLMVGTILGPGTILLMLVGAVNGVFGLDITKSLIINIIPVTIFIIICFLANNQFQLFVAQIFSALYVFLMLAVFVGTAIQAVEQPLSPSTIFFVLMISIFTVTALLHPREFSCFFSFPIYLLCIPSMYLLLTLYSLINLNIVSWGTRESATSSSSSSSSSSPPRAIASASSPSSSVMSAGNVYKTGSTPHRDAGAGNSSYNVAVGEKNERKNYFKLLHLNDVHNLASSSSSSLFTSQAASISLKFGNLFQCFFCTYDKPENGHLKSLEEGLHNLSIKIDQIIEPVDKKVLKLADIVNHNESDTLSTCVDNLNNYDKKVNTQSSDVQQIEEDDKKEDDKKEDDNNYALNSNKLSGKIKRYVNKNPRWLEDDIFSGCPILYLSNHENQFWRELIDTYLYPLDANKEHEKRVARELKDLRDKVMFGVLMLNGIFILTIFLLQLNRDKLSIRLPFRFDLVEMDTESIFNFNVTHPFKTIASNQYNAVGGDHDDDHDDADYGDDNINSNNKLEPVGASFIFTFALILILQVIGMIKHRISTFSHILAFVKLDFFRKPKENLNQDDFIERNAVEIAKDLQCLRGIDEDSSNTQDGAKSTLERQNTIFNLEKKKSKRNVKTMTLDVAFKKRFMSLSTRNRQEISRISERIKKRNAILALERRKLSLKSNVKPSCTSSTSSSSSSTVKAREHHDNQPNIFTNSSSTQFTFTKRMSTEKDVQAEDAGAGAGDADVEEEDEEEDEKKKKEEDEKKRVQQRPKLLWKSTSLQTTFSNGANETDANNSSESEVDTVQFDIDE